MSEVSLDWDVPTGKDVTSGLVLGPSLLEITTERVTLESCIHRTCSIDIVVLWKMQMLALL